MSEYKKKVSGVTSILIKDVHKGNKVHHSAWNDELKNNDRQLQDPRKRRNGKRKLNPIYGHIFRICGALFIIFFWYGFFTGDFKGSLPSWNTFFSNDERPFINSKPQVIDPSRNDIKQNSPYAVKQVESSQVSSVNRKDTSLNQSEKHVRISNDYASIQQTSVSGKVFSWIDEKGVRHASNVSYPVNNPTLTVKDEIKRKSVPVTKISVKNGQVYIPVTFHNGGRTITRWLTLDTGCSVTNLSFNHLKKLNVKYDGKSTSILADGSKKTNWKTTVDWIKVGPNYEYNFLINGSKRAGSENKGLLGLNFLKKHPFKIDFENEFIVWM